MKIAVPEELHTIKFGVYHDYYLEEIEMTSRNGKNNKVVRGDDDYTREITVKLEENETIVAA